MQNTGEKKLVLLTGATENVGKMLRPYLQQEYRLRLHTHRRSLTPLTPQEECIQADITDLTAAMRMVEGVDAVKRQLNRTIGDN